MSSHDIRSMQQVSICILHTRCMNCLQKYLMDMGPKIWRTSTPSKYKINNIRGEKAPPKHNFSSLLYMAHVQH